MILVAKVIQIESAAVSFPKKQHVTLLVEGACAGYDRIKVPAESLSSHSVSIDDTFRFEQRGPA